MLQKILIANRGEIALRVIRACRELGIATVAVYSEADRESLHVRFADEAVCIGPPPPAQSYLNIPRIISAAEITDSDGVHPGYGFLAENAEFADICETSGLTFIGPNAEMISRMGDKIDAKRTMKKADVPVIPGSEGGVKNEKEAYKLAQKIGFPVMLKAAAGGGGKGMRIVREEKGLSMAFSTAQTEAQAAFGNASLYMERYFEKPRHIEIQLLGDGKGQVIALGERECSIQRKHQKLIEESPSPAVSSDLRKEMVDAALRGAKSVGYRSAGTVEFLLDEDGKFYFMEMNTRIQVEHPVTEMVYGIDLLKEQIRVSAGGTLKEIHAAMEPKGHAIECRINVEDPFNQFRPTPGIITSFHVPGGFGIRVDTHAYALYKIPSNYDSLLAKIISHGYDRSEALNQMSRALEEFIIEGVPTTIPFHQQVLNDKKFIAGDFNTRFLESFELKKEIV
ncbi:acetyl-CoA carboxylase biotin carboxylase subunit [bacterium]|nr:acetyl-CoA carboxylase biotin carboxylase subunit [bacterium]RQV93718.1 MAG: acetyl-CoA carboxylase biotin carboxylase subunit [bacterium]